MILDLECMRYNKMQKSNGISLVEIVVYVALLGVLSVFVTNSLIQIAHAYQRVRSEREVLANARNVLSAIAASAAGARETYAPTSRFNSDAGQISFRTPVGAQPGHDAAYIDFWSDNGVVLGRAEGNAATTLSAASVRVSKLRFERIVQGMGREGIKITVQADAAPMRFPASVTLHATAALRGNY